MLGISIMSLIQQPNPIFVNIKQSSLTAFRKLTLNERLNIIKSVVGSDFDALTQCTFVVFSSNSLAQQTGDIYNYTKPISTLMFSNSLQIPDMYLGYPLAVYDVSSNPQLTEQNLIVDISKIQTSDVFLQLDNKYINAMILVNKENTNMYLIRIDYIAPAAITHPPIKRFKLDKTQLQELIDKQMIYKKNASDGGKRRTTRRVKHKTKYRVKY